MAIPMAKTKAMIKKICMACSPFVASVDLAG
jgi:hypothetical protein